VSNRKFRSRKRHTAYYLEKIHRGSGFQRAVLNFRLSGEVVGALDRRQHALDSKKRGQVGRVRRDDDEREKPPGAADDPPRHRSKLSIQAGHRQLAKMRLHRGILRKNSTRSFSKIIRENRPFLTEISRLFAKFGKRYCSIL